MSDNYKRVELEIIKYATLRNQEICLPMENITVEMLLLLGKKVVFLQQKGEIEAGKMNIEPLVLYLNCPRKNLRRSSHCRYRQHPDHHASS